MLAIWWIQDGAFSRIAKAIEVLEALTKGDTTKQIPQNKGFSSETNEAGHYQMFCRYRNHLLEMDEVRKDRAEKKTKRRSNYQKSGLLKMEGDAKILSQKILPI